ncbi:MAG: alpha-galactosidase [Oscillospiraceae bacterium]|nr:alpha-galactosidase [Oscillospiraceae bacterium]
MIVCEPSGHFFALHTAHTTYQMAVDEQGHLLHLYYGPRTDASAVVLPPHKDPGCWPNLLPQEWPAPGLGDHRAPFFEPEFADGTIAADLCFESAEVRPGKYSLPGLPAFWAQDPQGETLSITLTDAAGLTVQLLYGVIADCDLITRAAVIQNTGSAPLTLRGVPSFSLDLPRKDLDFLTLDGDWAYERTPHRTPLRPGVQSVGSVCGIPNHFHNPAALLCTPDATETSGECWGMALVYSGNFRIQAEQSNAGVRFAAGIEPYHFAWILAPGESFTTPEAALVYSNSGLGGMSRCFHTAIREHLIRGKYRDMSLKRPVLINSWEACYFTFDEEKLLALARAAKQSGVDLFVLDDGWFKGRNDDTTSLGDWAADTAKLPGGVDGLCRKINDLGLDFGIWVEPEAISPDSELFRAHSDWALQIPGRATLPIRHQYTLDFSRDDVREGIWQQLTALLDSCPIRYLKWDMNRSLANVYSAALPAARQGEVYHRYVLGVYDLQQRLIDRYPDLLLENCAGGGARFDCGMLYYSPQIWTSDNTDALSRLTIQYGTSLFYPPCTMGAHYSAVPNHVTGHVSDPQARMAAALSGTFGYELDLTAYSQDQRAELREWSAFYQEHGALIRSGTLYRLCPPDGFGSAWAIAAPDSSQAIVFAVGAVLDGRSLPLPFAAQGCYEAEIRQTGAETSRCVQDGEALRAHGLPLPNLHSTLPGYICYLKRSSHS